MFINLTLLISAISCVGFAVQNYDDKFHFIS